MGVDGFRDEDIFEGAAFAADFEVAVAVGSFPIVIDIDEELSGKGVVVGDFFRENENGAGEHGLADFGKKGESILGGEELEGEVEDDDGGARELDIANIVANGFDGGGEGGARGVFAAFGDHMRGVVDGEDAAAGGFDAVADGDGGSAEGGAEVVAVAVWGGEACGEGGEHGDDVFISGNGASDHVGEDGGDFVVKLEVSAVIVNGGEYIVPGHQAPAAAKAFETIF